jgi:hypothetical protein
MGLLSVESLAGYVLEDILAFLLQDNGYKLLVDASQDGDALEPGSNGLLVRGRGANHQADALGELSYAIPFSLPIRLFVEAKCQADSIGIADVRNALGVLSDVNERYAVDGKYQFPLRRHHYRYALFSTSGFADDAQQFALAHQISLIDLQGPAFAHLRQDARRTARELYDWATAAKLKSFPLKQMRESFRETLGTWNTRSRSDTMAGISADGELLNEELRNIATRLRRELKGKLLLGFPQGPFILALRPDNPDEFDAFLDQSASQISVDIRFASSDGGRTGEWAVILQGEDWEYGPIVRFGCPPLLESWLLTDGAIDPERAEQAKADFLADITVFHHGNRMTRLQYRKLPRKQSTGEIFESAVPDLRKSLADPGLDFSADDWTMEEYVIPATLEEGGRWTEAGMRKLLSLLVHDGLLWEVDFILFAMTEDGGRIGRFEADELAQVWGGGDTAKLVQRVNEIAEELRSEGIIGEYVRDPIRPMRDRTDDRISYYQVPPEFSDFVRSKQR